MNRTSRVTSLLTHVLVVLTMISAPVFGRAATTVATPTFTPAAGSYTGTQSVTINDGTSGATCYYTLTAGTSGTTPTTASTQYAGAISVTATSVLEALCTHSGDTNSAIATAKYTITVPTPTITPATGSFAAAQLVTLGDATSGATIYYTVTAGTSGKTPSSSSTQYSGPFTVSATSVVEAIAELSGDTNSSVATAKYTITLPVVATPTFSPAAGSYTGTQFVTISDGTSGATCYYTLTAGTSGTTPTTASTQYAGAISVTATSVLEALCTHSGDTNSAIATAKYTITVPTPTITPATGSFAAAQLVTLGDATSGATIYYTVTAGTSGKTPSSSSTQYSGPFTVSATSVVEAIAELSGDTNSSVATAKYTITLPVVATPTFSPAAGSYTGAQSVTIIDGTSGATCYYTLTAGTTGTTPTTNSTPYTGAISVTVTSVLEALCAYNGDTNSAVATAKYTITPIVATPTITPATESSASAVTVTLGDATSGATIYYTITAGTTGTAPTSGSTPYTGPFTVSATSVVEAIAELSGNANSAVTTATYTITPIVATPTITPGTESSASAVTVTLGDATSGATIYYTVTAGTTGTAPTSGSTPYTGPFTVSATSVVETIAELSGDANSAVASATYTITPTVATPTFTPVAGSYTGTQSVTISDATSGATCYYTLTAGTTGTTPTIGSTPYAGAIPVTATSVLEALCAYNGDTNSAVATAKYTITPVVATPTITPATEISASAVTVTLGDATSGATIYYTITAGTTGTAPTSGSTPYTGPFTVSATSVVEAIAEFSGDANSAVASATYTITPTVATPTITPGTESSPSAVTVTLGDATSGATIYYTVTAGTAGTAPTSSSTPYTGPFTVSTTSVVEAIAELSGDANSAVASATYTIIPSNTTATPVFSPVGGSYVGGQSLTLTDSTSGSTIYYTITPVDFVAISAGENVGVINYVADEDYSGGAFGTAATVAISTTGVTNPAPQAVYQHSRNAGTQTSFSYVIPGLTPGASYPVRLHFSENFWTAAGKRVFNVSINGTQVLPNFDIFASAGARYQALVKQFTTAADASGQITIVFTSVTDKAQVNGIEIQNSGGIAPTTSSNVYSAPVYVNATETIEAMATAPGYLQSATATALYTITPQAATPVFSPAAGTFLGMQTVTISDSTGGSIYYTTNGTTPTTASTPYTGPITVSATETLEAIATAPSYAQSALGTALYTITPLAATPAFSLAAGTYGSTQTVTITDSTGGSIYYTTDGTLPTTASILYTGAIRVSSTETIEAIATAPGYAQSATATALYIINLGNMAATPVFSPVGGSYVGMTNVALTDSTPGSTIYYTINSPENIAINAGGPSDGGNFGADAFYNGGAPGKAVTATISTAGVTNPASQSVYQTQRMANFQPSFSYVLPGFASGASYPVRLHFAETYWTAAGKREFNVTINGTQVLTNFDIFGSAGGIDKAIIEEFNAVADSNGQITIVFTSVIDNATVSGIEIPNANPAAPTTSSTVYTGPIFTNNPIESISAIATAPGYSQSAVATATYTSPAYPPFYTPAPGTYVGTQSVTIGCYFCENGTIYYTTDGTTPTTSSAVFNSSNPISVSSNETIQAFVIASYYSASPVGSGTFTIASSVATPTFTVASGTYPGPQLVEINEVPLNATIYYTLTNNTTGTAPTTTSAVYTRGTAITVSSTSTLEAIAAVPGYAQSSTAIATYTIAPTTASTTTLAMTSGGSPVTTVASPSLVTLTATVASGAARVTTGTVSFCDATAPYCTDVHVLGTAQLTSAGTAAINIRPSVGSHSYKAVFVGTSSCSSSSSSTAQLTVTMTGSDPTAIGITATDSTYGYTVYAEVIGSGNFTVGPTGTVSILDTSNSNSVLGTASLSGASPGVAFTNAPTITFPNAYLYDYDLVAVGDFNGNGQSDLVVFSDYPSSSITILLSNGDGTFTPASGSPIPWTYNSGPYSVTVAPNSVAVGDFDGDGMQDVVIGDTYGDLTFLKGKGHGTFAAASTPMAFGCPAAGPMSIADFNGDGKLDLAVPCSTSYSMMILLGNGDGTFTQAIGSPITLWDTPVTSSVGDFDGDGIPDLVVGLGGAVTILHGNGDGTFTPTSQSPIFMNINEMKSIAVGDFSKNGKLDLAVTGFYYPDVDILMGNGDGTFNPPTIVQVGDGPYSIAVGDFNLDGVPDLAVANNFDGTVSMLIGRGDGTFGAPGSATLTANAGPYSGDGIYGLNATNLNGPESVVIGNFSGNGIPGVAVVSAGAGAPTPSTITVFQTGLGEIATATVTGVMPLGFGTHYVEATYGGDTNYTASASGTIPLTAGVVVSPNNGTSGVVVTITGNGFGSAQGNSSVTVGGIAVVANTWTNTQIKTQIPNGLTLGPQSVVVTVGSQSASGTFFITPWITGITPSSGLPGTFVNITGTNFGSQASVTFNGISAQVINWTATSIQVIAPPESSAAPAGVTTGPVIVTAYDSSNELTYASNGVTFTVPSGPTITGLSPVYGPIGTSVTISGFNFGTSSAAGTVAFNGVPASPTSWGSESIIVPVPATATTGPVIVSVGGGASNSYTYTVSAGIAGIAPAQGYVGTPVTISGTGFGPTQGSVTFNGVPAIPSKWNNTSITVPVPPDATTGNVAVTVNGTAAVGPVFQLLPVIGSLSPSAGPVGTVVVISGSNFGSTQGTSSVAFGQITAVPTKWSQDAIVVSVPPAAVTSSVVVTVGGTASNAVPFTIGATTTGMITGTITQSDGVTPIAGATVTISNGSGQVATALTATSGTYAVSNLSVATYNIRATAFGFGVQGQTGLTVSPIQATVVNLSLPAAPAIAYTYDELGRLVGVVDPVNGSAGYSYDAVGNIKSINRSTPGQVSILDFTPKSGPVGTLITVSGTSFSGNAPQDAVAFTGANATASSATSSQISVVVPAGATSGPISVTTPSGTATGSASYTVTANSGAPVISSFTPATALASTPITISGTGFDVLANDRVSFNGALASLTSATPTSISLMVPANATSGLIAIATPAGTAISSANFFLVPATYLQSQIDFTGQIAKGGSYTGTIINGGDIGIVLFNATAGQQFNLLVNGSSIASATISVTGPGESLIEQDTIGAGATTVGSITAPTAGTYTILVASNGPTYTGNLTLTLQ